MIEDCCRHHYHYHRHYQTAKLIVLRLNYYYYYSTSTSIHEKPTMMMIEELIKNLLLVMHAQLLHHHLVPSLYQRIDYVLHFVLPVSQFYSMTRLRYFFRMYQIVSIVVHHNPVHLMMLHYYSS